jgi:hypothetical protein
VEIAALTAFLAPFLSRLLAGGEQLVEGAAEELGKDAWGHARRLWSRLRDKVAGKEAASEAAADVAAKPDDERALSALELQLEKLLAADERLSAEVAKLWEDAKRDGAVAAIGERSIAVGGDVSGSTFVTGDQNTVSE